MELKLRGRMTCRQLSFQNVEVRLSQSRKCAEFEVIYDFSVHVVSTNKLC